MALVMTQMISAMSAPDSAPLIFIPTGSEVEPQQALEQAQDNWEQVARATPLEMAHLGQICHLESRFARLPYDAERVAQRFAHMIEHPASANFFVAAHDAKGVLHGLMIGSIDEYFFCRERIASSVFLLVHPEHRGGLAAIKMVLAFLSLSGS
eukprot:gene577-728_t